ncbi:MAG TPA: hypothetical protein VN700_10860 [Vicinamibacterales bacterium]|nr:hypothetical protein [Vicinamibacterales bacterium]
MALPPAGSFNSRLLFVGAALAAFLLLNHSARVIGSSVGQFQDSLWDYNPAVGMANGISIYEPQEISIGGRPVPLTTGSYQGATRTWTLVPLLKIFGTSPRTITTLNAVYAFAYLLALSWALVPAVGRRLAWLAFVVPFVDTNLLVTMPHEPGPSLTQYIFGALSIGALLRYVATGSTRHLLLTAFFEGALLAQKLTAIPLVIGFVVVTTLVSLPGLRRARLERGAADAISMRLILPVFVFLVPLFPHLLYLARAGTADLLSMTDATRTPYFTALFQNFGYGIALFDGVDWYGRMTIDPAADSMKLPPFLAWTAFALAGGSVLLGGFRQGWREHGRFVAVTAAVLTASFLAYPAFAGLNRPWHLYIMMPLVNAIGLMGLVHVALSAGAAIGRPRAAGIVAAVALAAASGLGLVHGLTMVRRFDAMKGIGMTSPALYEIYQATDAAHPDRVVTLNYSLGSPLFVLSNARFRTHDLAWTALTATYQDELLDDVEKNESTAIVYRLCRDTRGDGDWIRWQNREPEIFDFIKRVEARAEKLSVTRVTDNRQTEFVLIRKRRPGDSR